MKFYVQLLTFSCFMLYISCEGMQSCITDENCAEGECCISMVFVRGFCHTLGDIGDHCITEPAITEHEKKNIFGCPCKVGLKCIPETVKESDGKTVMKNHACISSKQTQFSIEKFGRRNPTPTQSLSPLSAIHQSRAFVAPI
ncbi:hypothetical protein JTE90_009901 [Oedothorax gibbosus]|uniref:Prokineticin domain-containing protein n=1 Tax=Oedothorax gibbosus TaxID=931172 RepID=A0AAV6UW34_9ARAC|nr:hypothetical protein JTE90_009901 [Oedothorax gibbosus]